MIEFDTSLQTGNKLIDDQHRHLIGIFNTIESNSYISVEDILKELSDYISYHFSIEENLLKKYSYPDANNHIIEHKEYIDKINNFIKNYGSDESILYEIDAFLIRWIIVHIKNSDQAYARYFKEKGIF